MNPQAPQQPFQPYAQPVQNEAYPGKTLGLVAFILSFFAGPVSLVLGIVAKVQSKRSGHKNGFALAAIIISIVGIVIATVTIGLVVALAGYAAVQLNAQCEKLGPGTHTDGATTITCGDNSQPTGTSTSIGTSTSSGFSTN